MKTLTPSSSLRDNVCYSVSSFQSKSFALVNGKSQTEGTSSQDNLTHNSMKRIQMSLKAIALLMLLYLFTSNAVAQTRVQFKTGSVNSGTSIAMTALSPAPANGNTLVAVISTRGTAQNQVTSITQTGATWSRVTQSGAGASTGSTTEIWYAPNVSGAGTAITINLGATLRAAAVVIEYSGLLSPNPSDVSNNNFSSGTAGTNATTGTTATTTQANELWIGGIGLVSSSISLSAITNSFNTITNVSSGSGTASNNARIYALERIVTATGTAGTGGTISSSSQWSGAIATFIKTSLPTIVLSSPSQITSGDVITGATNTVLSKFQSAITVNDATLNSIDFTSAGTYQPSDIANFNLYFNTSGTFPGGAPLATLSSTLDAGIHSFTGLSQVITSGTTGFFWITTDISLSATAGNTINIVANPTLTFSAGTPTGSISAGGAQTIISQPVVVISSPNLLSLMAMLYRIQPTMLFTCSRMM